MSAAAAGEEAAAPALTARSKPAAPWGGWGKTKPAAAAPSLAELMDEQLAERLQRGDRPAEPQASGGANGVDGVGLTAAEAAAMDPDLALALALSLSEAPQPPQLPQPPPEQEEQQEEDGEEEDPDLALARKLAAEEEEEAAAKAGAGAGAGGEGGDEQASADLALAMLLQEEERAAAVAAREERQRRARQQLGDLGQAYSKVQLAFHQELAAAPVGGGGGRVLLGEGDAERAGEGAEEEEEGEGGDDDPLGLGLSGLSVVGAGGGRRRRRGELMRTAGGAVITKHDAALNARVNALDLVGRFQGVGDLEAEASMRVPTRAYNALKHDLRRQAGTLKGVAHRGKMEGAARATQEGVLDARTRLILFKILNTGLLFQEVQGVVKTGKESFVYFAPAAPAPSAATASATTTFVVGGDAPGGGPGGRGAAAAAAAVDLTNEEEEVEDEADSYVDDAEEDEGASGSEAGGSTAPSLAPPPSSSASAAAAGAPPLPEWDRSRGCAIKVFKTTLNEFSKRGEYVEGDPRYHESLKFNKQTSRRMFKLWAEKEYRNLLRMHRAGLPCPVPLEQKEHVLVMSFLGTEDGWPSPQLREAKLSPKAWAKCYRRVCRLLRDLYQKAGLVHGDLSEYNIILHDGRPFLIDVGQSVRTAHPRAPEFLKRDLHIVSQFFRRQLGDGGGVMPDAALLAFVRMRRPRRAGGGEEDGEGKEGQGQGQGDEAEEEVVEAILDRLMEGLSFEAAVAGTGGFEDPGGRAGGEGQEEAEA